MSKGCATNVVPLLARIVLGIAFVYHGLTKISTVEYSGADAAKLNELGAEMQDDGTVKGRGLDRIALMLEDSDVNWPAPIWMARIAAGTELIGGGLLLFGFLSRIWALGLAITMGMAFYLTTVPKLCNAEQSFFELAGDASAMAEILQNGAGYQLALFALAAGVLLSGPGAVSIDRMLFSKRGGDGSSEEPPLS